MAANPQRAKQEEVRAQAIKTIQARYKESSRNLLVGNAAGISLVGPILGGLAFSSADTQLPVPLVSALNLFVFGALFSQSAVVAQYFGFGAKASLMLTPVQELQREEGLQERLLQSRTAYVGAEKFFLGGAHVLLLSGAVVALTWIWIAALT